MLSVAGSVASILSLIFTVWVILEVRSLRLFYKRHLLLPRFTQELARHAKNARKAIESKRTEEVKGVLQKCDALIERVPKYADKALAARAQNTRDSIAKLLGDHEHNLLTHSYEVINELDATIESALAFTGEDQWATRK